jgi:hypothetical protein
MAALLTELAMDHQCTVRSGEVIELLPFGEPCSKVHIIGVGEELIELLLISAM